MGDHMIELCCFDLKLKWVKIFLVLTGDALLTMRSITEAIATSGTHAISVLTVKQTLQQML